jgi:hypothetical protein
MNDQRRCNECHMPDRADEPTIFGFPVTLSAEIADGEIVLLSDAIEIDEDGIRIDPKKFMFLINCHRHVTRLGSQDGSQTGQEQG